MILKKFLSSQSETDVDSVKVLLGKQFSMLHRLLKNKKELLQDYEFQVFSQFGDDGIIQHLVSKLSSIPKTFIEFGVENYQESNTRFLLVNNNWSGLVMDGSKKNIDYIIRDRIYWRNDLHARCAFITKSNINRLFEEEGFTGPVGILSIDIDGNDYWIWKEISIVHPSVVIVEYNSVFGSDRAITVPYQEDFYRMKAHSSGLYWGVSLPALVDVAHEKGYIFIGCNSAGNNAYFIEKNTAKGKFKELSIKKGYVESKFRESRDDQGRLTFLSGKARLEMIKGMPVYNVKTKKIEKL